MRHTRHIYAVGQGGFAIESIGDMTIAFDCGSTRTATIEGKIKDAHSEILSFNIVTKDYSKQYCISSEAFTEEKEDCMFPHLTQVETDDSISFMNPIVQAFKNA